MAENGMNTHKDGGKRTALIIGGATALGVLAAYTLGYFFLCGRCVDGPDRFSGSPKIVRVRGYYWNWCEIVFIPAAWIESRLTGNDVALVADPDWLPYSWMSPRE